MVMKLEEVMKHYKQDQEKFFQEEKQKRLKRNSARAGKEVRQEQTPASSSDWDAIKKMFKET